jgi:hypothetical protein
MLLLSHVTTTTGGFLSVPCACTGSTDVLHSANMPRERSAIETKSCVDKLVEESSGLGRFEAGRIVGRVLYLGKGSFLEFSRC